MSPCCMANTVAVHESPASHRMRLEIRQMLGQGMSDFDAAVLGVHIHGLAGDIAAEKVGQISVIATDIAHALSEAFMRA